MNNIQCKVMSSIEIRNCNKNKVPCVLCYYFDRIIFDLMLKSDESSKNNLTK